MNQENQWPFYISIVLAIYAVIILFFVVRGAMKSKTISDYAIGNMGFPSWIVGLSLAASMTSAATFVINPGFIALYGLSGIISMAIVLPVAAFASLIFFTKGFAKFGKSVKANTMSQWIGTRFKNKYYQFFFAIIAMLLITFIVLINVGLTQVISKSLDTDPFYVLLAITVFVFGYMMFGGANSMLYTNTIQALIMVVVALMIIFSGVDLFEGGVSGFTAKLNAIDPNLTKTFNESSPLYRDFFEVVICQAIVGVAIVCQPHIMTKSLMLKNPEKVNYYLFFAIVSMAIFFLIVIAGLYARIMFPDLTVDGNKMKMDEIIPVYVVKRFSVAAGILVVVGLISAGLSTLEGLIQSLSITVTSDILEPVFGEKITKNGLVINKVVIVLLAVVSFYFSWNQMKEPNLSVGIFGQNGVYGYFAAAFVPVLFGTFVKNVKSSTVFAASVVAIVVHFGIFYLKLTPYMQGTVGNPGVSAAIAICSSLFVAIILHTFNKDKEVA